MSPPAPESIRRLPDLPVGPPHVVTQPAGGRHVPMPLALATLAGLLVASALVFLIHRSLSSTDGSPVALMIAVGWTAAFAVFTSLGSRHRVLGLLLTALGLAAVAGCWDWLQAHVDVVYLVQHAGSHALLAIWFGGSLLAARKGTGETVITRLATRLHGPLPPHIRRYTARVTAFWTTYFVLMALASCALFAFGSLQAWSTLANLVTMPLVVALFVAEYLIRIRLYPDFDHVSILDGIRAYLK